MSRWDGIGQDDGQGGVGWVGWDGTDRRGWWIGGDGWGGRGGRGGRGGMADYTFRLPIFWSLCTNQAFPLKASTWPGPATSTRSSLHRTLPGARGRLVAKPHPTPHHSRVHFLLLTFSPTHLSAFLSPASYCLLSHLLRPAAYFPMHALRSLDPNRLTVRVPPHRLPAH